VEFIIIKIGIVQLQLSLKVFNKFNVEYICKLECGTIAGITFGTTDKIILALDSELKFREFESFKPN